MRAAADAGHQLDAPAQDRRRKRIVTAQRRGHFGRVRTLSMDAFAPELVHRLSDLAIGGYLVRCQCAHTRQALAERPSQRSVAARIQEQLELADEVEPDV